MGADNPETWRVEIALPEGARPAPFEAALEALGGALTTRAANGGGVRLTVHSAAAPDRALLAARLAVAAAAAGIAVPEAAIDRLPPTDWVAAYRKALVPQRVARFFIHPSDFAGAVPDAAIAIRLDAGLAFGTGEHESTRGCLLAFDRLAGRRVGRALDMGCGSGILSIAAAKLWRAPVLACDNDPLAVDVAAANAAANGVADLVGAVQGDGFASPAVAGGGPYDLIAANILAGTLIDMAPALAAALSPDGVAVLSGILDEQAADVAAAHRTRGLARADVIRLGEWTTLIVSRG